MINLDWQLIVSFGLYLAFMLLIGIYFYRKTKNLSDYVLGGRGLGSWVTAMSAQASDMSGWLLMGLPGYAYLAGLESIWIAIGLAAGTYLNWKFVAARLRKYTELAGDSITLPDFFENRFRDKSKIIRIISALFILIFFIIYTSSGFVAGAKLFSTIFELSYFSALIIGVAVIISYTFLGGFLAVSWTDFFQGTLMFIAIVTVPVVAVSAIGGVSDFFTIVENTNAEWMKPLTESDGSSLGFLAILSMLGWGLGYFGQPHILARFMAIKNAKMIKRSRLIAMNWVVISLFASVLVGLIGAVYLDVNLQGPDTETVFILLVNKTMPGFLAGIFLSAILAAIMSTADSQLLVASSSITEDFYNVLFRKNAGDKELVWVGRVAVVLVAIIAFIIAMDPESQVLELVAYAWAGFGATFGPLILFSLFWRGITRSGAIAGIVVGGITVVIWKNISGGIFELYEIIPGFLFSSLAIFIASITGKKPDPEIEEEFNKTLL